MADVQPTLFDDVPQEIEYRAVLGFPNYRVGSDGSVWSNFFGSWRPVKPSGKRYRKVWLCPGRVCCSVHTLILEAFIGPCPPGMQACHSPDRSKTNNALSNLRWGTPVENQGDRIEHGTDCRGEKNYRAAFTDDQIRSIRLRWESGNATQTALAREHGVTKHTIHLIVHRKNWKHVL